MRCARCRALRAIAPLLSTIGVGLVLDQVAQLLFTPDPRGLASQVPSWRLQIGGGTIGALDLLIAAIGLLSALLLYVFLRFTKLGWAVRATALDRDAAQQCGVDVDRVNSAGFAIAAALGGISGFLVGMYYNSIDPNMGYQAGLKGIVAQMIGGMGNVPGAIAGSLLLGLIESYGIAILGTSYRNLFAFVVMILILVLKPNGIFSRGRRLPPEPLTGTFIAPSAPICLPAAALIAAVLIALALPLVVRNGYILQTLGIGWLYAILAISLTLVAGTAGQISLGHAGLLAIGAYASALLAIDLKIPVAAAIICAGVMTAVLGTLIILPSFRLRGHYVTIATMKIILGLMQPRSGTIVFDGQPIKGLRTPQIIRRGLGSVPEARRLFGGMTVRENVLMGAFTRTEKPAILQDYARMMELFPRLRERSEQQAGTLSGGEQQMVAMARALMGRPRVICMDEPTMGLSPLHVDRVLELIRKVNQEGVTIFMVEQNAHLALQIADYGYVLQTGRIVLSGPAGELMHDSRISGCLPRRRRQPIRGQ